MKRSRIGAAVVALALVATACGSDAESTPATDAPPAAEATDAGEEAVVTTAGAVDASAAEAEAAAAAVAAFTEAPTAIKQTVPLTGSVAQEKTYVVIGCELPQCNVISDGALAAAKALGWKTEYLQYDALGDGAATLHQAMVDALTYDPFAVSPIGFSQQVWADLLPDYEEAGVIITSIADGDNEPGGPVTEGASNALDYIESGEIMAQWFTADSGGVGKALVQDTPAYAVLKKYGDGFKAKVAEICSACELTLLDIAPAQLADAVPTIVSALQKDPDIKYVIATDGAFIPGLPSALKAAGLEGIKIAGGAADVNNFIELTTGGNSAWTAEAPDQFGWVAVDILARTLLGMDIDAAGGGRPQMLVTADNVGKAEDWALGLPFPGDYEAQFKALWGV